MQLALTKIELMVELVIPNVYLVLPNERSLEMKHPMTILLVLCTLLLVLSPAFAAGTKEEASGPVTLTFVETMTSPSRTAQIQELIAKYEAQNPNVKINLVSPPYEQADNKLTLMLNSNQELDIIEVRDHTVKQYVNNNK